MRILFCNITYLKYYDGRVLGEYKPQTGGRWVRENEDAHEKWNFLNVDGYCYGYVQGNSDQMHIEKLDKVFRHQEEADDITVVWCASHPTRGTVVVGWYEHATVYRRLEDMITTPITGLERCYWFKTKAEDAYLLPEDDRTLEIGRASKTGAGTGFGQQNYWFAESRYAKENIIPNVMEFIKNNRNKRTNVLTEKFMQPESLKQLTKEEERLIKKMDDDSFMEFLPYAYRKYAFDQTADNAYNIAACLHNLFQYKMSIPWYEKTVELAPDDKQTKETLVYMYQQCEEYDKSKALALKLLEDSAGESDEYRDELYSVIADDCCLGGDPDEGIIWLNKVLKESNDKELIEYTKKTKKLWLELRESLIK